MRVKKNDVVYVNAGKEKGKTGKVLKVFSSEKRVVVEGLNFVKRHTKAVSESEPGGIVEKEAPIHISNVLVYCEKCQRGVRVGHKVLEDGNKVRYCRKCGEQFGI